MDGWHELSLLQERHGVVLLINMRNGNMWTGSLESKPHRHDATHWQPLPDVSHLVAKWHEDFKREWGEYSHREYFPDMYKTTTTT